MGFPQEIKNRTSTWFGIPPSKCIPKGNKIIILKRFLYSHVHTAAATTKSLQSSPTPCDPIDGSPPGSPIPGILQARTLEWVAISFSKLWVKYRQIWGHFNLNPSVKIFNKLSSFKLFYSYINTYKKMARHLILH